MKKYNYAQINEHIQWLVKMMETEYPNNYELIIDSIGGTIRSTQTELTFLKQDLKNSSKPILERFLEEGSCCRKSES